MDSSDFSALVGRLERESDDDPRAYAIKTVLVTALGYALIALVAIAILIACGLLIDSIVSGERFSGSAFLGCIAGAATLFAVIRASRVQIDAPQGREITREEAPALFAAIDDVIERMAAGNGMAVTVDTVTLNNEFNASICQIPQWGVFGNYRNHLLLGVPLMAALGVAEFKSVVAHEIGHLGGEHGRFAAWIYRQRMTWRALEQKFEDPENIFEQILSTFYGWYAPYFYAYTFVLARNHEYAADQAAARATNAGILGRALIKVELMGRFLGEVFWKRLYGQVEKMRDPEYQPYSMMPRAFAVAQKEWSRQDWLQSSLRRVTAEDDTHPSLGERLAALGVQPQMPTYLPDSSAMSLFESAAPEVFKWCDEQWREEHGASWRKRHDAIKEIRWKIAEYENSPAAELTPEDLWQKALLVLDLGEEAEAIEELQMLVAREPSMAQAQFLLGRLLLDYGNEQGLQNLVLAGQHDLELAQAAGELGYDYLMKRGRKAEAQRFWERVRVE